METNLQFVHGENYNATFQGKTFDSENRFGLEIWRFGVRILVQVEILHFQSDKYGSKSAYYIIFCLYCFPVYLYLGTISYAPYYLHSAYLQQLTTISSPEIMYYFLPHKICSNWWLPTWIQVWNWRTRYCHTLPYQSHITSGYNSSN